MKAKQLREMLEAHDVSQRRMSKALGINERTMRRYVSGEQPVPMVVEFALYAMILLPEGLDKNSEEYQDVASRLRQVWKATRRVPK